MAQLRSKPISLAIANNKHYALRKGAKNAIYQAVSGEFTTRGPASNKRPTVNTPRDLKFRAIGPSIVTEGLGQKELHMRIRGKISYQQSNELLTIYNDVNEMADGGRPDKYDEETWAHIMRYINPLFLLDLELWPTSSGMPTPWRDPTRNEIDSDFTPNAPVSRTNLLNLALTFSSARFVGQSAAEDEGTSEDKGPFDRLVYALGVRTLTIDQYIPIPIAAIDSLATKVAPVATLHIGGRSLGANNINVDLELDGALFYLAD